MSSVIFGDGPVIPESVIVPQKVGASKVPKSSTVRKSAVKRSTPITNNVSSAPMLTGYDTPEEAMVAPVPATGIAGLAAAGTLQQNMNPSIYGNNTYGGGSYVDNYVRGGLASRSVPTIDATGIGYSSMEIPRNTTATNVSDVPTRGTTPNVGLLEGLSNKLVGSQYGYNIGLQPDNTVGYTENGNQMYTGSLAGNPALEYFQNPSNTGASAQGFMGGLGSSVGSVWDKIGGAKGFSDIGSGLASLYSMYTMNEQNKRVKEAFNNMNADRDAQYRANDAWNRGIAASGLGTANRPTKG